MSDAAVQPRYRRFSVSDRLEHWVQVVAFTGLAVTGLIQMWSEGWFATAIIGALGGINSTRLIHRSFAIIVLVAVAYHVGTAGYRFFVLRSGRQMLPGFDDGRAAARFLAFNLGFSSEPAYEGRFTFAEKLEYWSIVWGTVLMAVTGLMMWNPIATTSILSGEFIPAAKAAHGAEAVLAVLAILIWHTYFVHVKEFNTSMMDGYLSEEAMAAEHPAELDAIKAGDDVVITPPETLRRRRRWFFPTYGAIVVLAAVFLVAFLTYQDGTITTVQPQGNQVEIFTPYTPTTVPSSADAAPPTVAP